MMSPHFEHLLNYDFTDYYTPDDSSSYASYLTLQQQLADYERQFNPYSYINSDLVLHTDSQYITSLPEATTLQPGKQYADLSQKITGNSGKMKTKLGKPCYTPFNVENKENREDLFPSNYQQDDFVMCVKRQRIRLGFTQADVGISLGALYNKHFSQTTVCR